MRDFHVLLVGYRPQIREVLEKHQIPYFVWNSRPLLKPIPQLFVGKFTSNLERLRRLVATQLPRKKFTHVIAGTEAAVYPASLLRRIVGARHSVHTTILKCHNKLHMKLHLAESGIPISKFYPIIENAKLDKIWDNLKKPVVLKPYRQSGGRGQHIIDIFSEFKQKAKPNMLVEEFIDAPEASVESIVDNSKIIFENTTEYYVKKHINIVPATLDSKHIQQVMELNRRIVSCLKINWGLTHAEYFLTDDGPVFGEIALRPPGGHIMDLIGISYNFNFWEFFVLNELGIVNQYNQSPKYRTSANILHPGEGVVCKLFDIKEIRSESYIINANLKLKVGDRVSSRSGAGESVGHYILKSELSENIHQTIKKFQDKYRIICKDKCKYPIN